TPLPPSPRRSRGRGGIHFQDSPNLSQSLCHHDISAWTRGLVCFSFSTEGAYMRACVIRFLWASVAAILLAVGLQAQTNKGTQSQTQPQADKSASETPPPPPGKGALSKPNDDPFPSTYHAPAAKPFAITNATILTAAGPTIQRGTIVVREGKIAAVGAG